MSREELDGLSERYISGLAKNEKTGRYKVSLDYPESGPFMAKAHNEDARCALAEKNLRKGGVQNMKLLARIVAIRRESANILGYKTHADYKTETRTVKTTARAMKFVRRLFAENASRTCKGHGGPPRREGRADRIFSMLHTTTIK